MDSLSIVGLVEIKCPFGAKHSHPDVMRRKQQTYLGVNGMIKDQVSFVLRLNTRKACNK